MIMKNMSRRIKKNLLKLTIALFAVSIIPSNASTRITGTWCGDGPDEGASIEFYSNQSFAFELASGEEYEGVYLIKNGEVNMVFYYPLGTEVNLNINKRNNSLDFYESATNNSSFTRC